MSTMSATKIFKRISKGIILLFFLSLMFILYKEISYYPTSIEVNYMGNEVQSSLGYYYLSSSKGPYLNRKEIVFDKNGIPIIKINGQYHYHPVYISQFALGAYDHYLITMDTTAKQSFMQCALWLKDNLEKRGEFYYWNYNFKNDGYPGGIYEVPWFSAMAQGQGASVLLRAFCETKDEKYLSAAKMAITPMFYNITDGGISIINDSNYIFPQEYPTTPPSDILNGAIFAYFGLYDYYRVTHDPNIKNLCRIVENTLLNTLPQYDTGYWSLYSLWPGYFASPGYNLIHIAQLKILYLITEKETFLKYSEKFEGYQKSWLKRTRSVFCNHLVQIKEFGFDDMTKIPLYLKKIITS